MTTHEGTPAGNRYPRPLRCVLCGDEWEHTPHDNERFTFVLELRGGVCFRCMSRARHEGRGSAPAEEQAVMRLEEREWCKRCFRDLPTEAEIDTNDGKVAIEECRTCGGLRLVLDLEAV